MYGSPRQDRWHCHLFRKMVSPHDIKGHILSCLDLSIQDIICQENSWWYYLNSFTSAADRLEAKSLPESQNKQSNTSRVEKNKAVVEGYFPIWGSDQGYHGCLWGPLGIHFINFKPHMCIWGILEWWRLHAPTSASPSPPHMLLCLSLVHCIVTRAHGAGGLVCMLSLIIASGKTIFLCKIECIADCECCDNRQTGRSAHRHPPCPSRHWLSLWQLSLWSSFYTMQPIIMHGSHIQIPSEIAEVMGEEPSEW